MNSKISKRYKKLINTFKDKKIATLDEAIKKVKESCTAKFDESIDVSLNLNLKQKKEEVSIRTIVKLPHGNGKKIKVGVLCEESKIDEAKSSGAEVSGSENLVNEILSGKIAFDKLVANYEYNFMTLQGKNTQKTNHHLLYRVNFPQDTSEEYLNKILSGFYDVFYSYRMKKLIKKIT